MSDSDADLRASCTKCGAVLDRRAGQFYFRGRFFHGLVCATCNSLWDDPSDSFEQHVIAEARNAQAQSIQVTLTAAEARECLAAERTCWDEGQFGLPPTLLLEIRRGFPALVAHEFGNLPWENYEAIVASQKEALMTLGNVLEVDNASIRGHVVRSALYREMETALEAVAPLRDPDIRRYFERLFWTAASLWTSMIDGGEGLEEPMNERDEQYLRETVRVFDQCLESIQDTDAKLDALTTLMAEPFLEGRPAAPSAEPTEPTEPSDEQIAQRQRQLWEEMVQLAKVQERRERARWSIETFHSQQCYPDYEYETTQNPRKSGDSPRPSGDDWEPNPFVTGDGRNWERFEFHEDNYWMRKRRVPPEGTP